MPPPSDPGFAREFLIGNRMAYAGFFHVLSLQGVTIAQILGGSLKMSILFPIRYLIGICCKMLGFKPFKAAAGYFFRQNGKIRNTFRMVIDRDVPEVSRSTGTEVCQKLPNGIRIGHFP